GTPVRILGHDLVSPAKELAAALFAHEPPGSSREGPLEVAQAVVTRGATKDDVAISDPAGETVLERDCEARLESSAEEERMRLESELLTSDQLPEELERSRLTHATLGLGLQALSVEGG